MPEGGRSTPRLRAIGESAPGRLPPDPVADSRPHPSPTLSRTLASATPPPFDLAPIRGEPQLTLACRLRELATPPESGSCAGGRSLSPHGRPRLSVYAVATSWANSYTIQKRRLKGVCEPYALRNRSYKRLCDVRRRDAERLRLGDRVLGVRVREELIARPRLAERAGQVFRCHREPPSPSA